MPIDHFSTHDSGTFEQRVCLYTNYYVNDAAAAPMFFYTGNESPVEEYINNTGLMWELGARLGTVLVWAEHRFEPMSHPRLDGSPNCFAFGTTAQALQDFRVSDGWTLGVGGQAVAGQTIGLSGGLQTSRINRPIVEVVFGQRGLIADASFAGAKYNRIVR